MRQILLIAGTTLASLTACGPDCDRAGCLALVREAENTGPGIAGVVAIRDDVIANGCQECSFDRTTLTVWATEDVVSSPESVARFTMEETPIASIVALERYEQPLEPGRYLVCADSACVNISVAEGGTTTVNVKRRAQGPTTFFVREPDASRFVERNGLRHDES